ncbi:MAG: hypothetical protein HON90_02860 [Halobacteriovoraceae bacterium]|jgi:hypothetical protein|nr:hypothetical protein [Halobacteriovoraceae bacterium]
MQKQYQNVILLFTLLVCFSFNTYANNQLDKTELEHFITKAMERSKDLEDDEAQQFLIDLGVIIATAGNAVANKMLTTKISMLYSERFLHPYAPSYARQNPFQVYTRHINTSHVLRSLARVGGIIGSAYLGYELGTYVIEETEYGYFFKKRAGEVFEPVFDIVYQIETKIRSTLRENRDEEKEWEKNEKLFTRFLSFKSY